uniref:Putative secreted peptide n=1 Tax=Anopheles braziliensis TaxID=58242 RepID=A0A2M3ZRN3_9DIPT
MSHHWWWWLRCLNRRVNSVRYYIAIVVLTSDGMRKHRGACRIARRFVLWNLLNLLDRFDDRIANHAATTTVRTGGSEQWF